MIRQALVPACAVVVAALAGCGATSSVDTGTSPTGSVDDGLSGTQAQFDSMTSPCIAQASRMAGVSRGAITVTDRIRTGGGPLLTLNAGRTQYSCRLEDDGTVTVFSEYGN
jgi:hypothetical protein